MSSCRMPRPRHGRRGEKSLPRSEQWCDGISQVGFERSAQYNKQTPGVSRVVDAAENRSPKFYGGPQSVSCCAMISNSLILGDLPEQKRPEYVEGFAPSRAGQGDTLRRGIRGAIVACHWLILVVIRGSSTIVKSSSSWLSQRQPCNPEKKTYYCKGTLSQQCGQEKLRADRVRVLVNPDRYEGYPRGVPCRRQENNPLMLFVRAGNHWDVVYETVKI